MSLMDLSIEVPTADEHEAILHKIEEMEAHSAVLILSAHIDRLLEMAIAVSFPQSSSESFERLFRKTGAPLHPLSAKIQFGFAMGIYNAEYRAQMDRIRAIRNAFAHALKIIDFDHPTIASECMNLDPRRLISKSTKLKRNGLETARIRFVASAHITSTLLMEYINAKIAGEDVPIPFLGKYA